MNAGPDSTGNGPLMGTVLLVDDDPEILESLGMFLESALRVSVLSAASGSDALEILAEGPVDLMVSDYRMPNMDGLTLIGQATQAKPGLRTILLTAYPDPGLESRAMHEYGVARFLSKALRPDALLEAVKGALQTPKAP